MIQFSEATAIALHSMIYLAKKEEPVSLKEIAQKFKISDNHLSKVLQRLVKAGYLISTKGPKGGFNIVESKKEASFLEIYEVIEGKWVRKNCLFTNPNDCCCCIIKGMLGNINNKFETFMTGNKLDKITL